MKLTILAVGKLKESWVREGCEEYARRLRPHFSLELTEVKDGSDLLRRISPRSRVWALDEHGKQFSSEELGGQLRTFMNTGEAGWTFLIGGADGLPAEVLKASHLKWSLGRLTLPHRLARVVLLEQLYRASSIVRGEPYHRA